MKQQSRKQHLAAIVARIDRAAKELGCGIPADMRWAIDAGSAVNGRAWRLNWQRIDTGADYRPFSGMNDFLGLTYAEAEDALYRIADVIESIAHYKGN